MLTALTLSKGGNNDLDRSRRAGVRESRPDPADAGRQSWRMPPPLVGGGWGRGPKRETPFPPPNLPRKGGGAVLAALSLTLTLPAPSEFGRNANGSNTV